MDLSELNTKEFGSGVVSFVPEHPVTGEPIGGAVVSVTALFGPEAEKKKLAFRRELLRLKKSGAEIPEDMAENAGIEVLCTVTKAIEGLDYKGKPIGSDMATMIEIFGNTGFQWLADQITKVADDKKKFFAAWKTKKGF